MSVKVAAADRDLFARATLARRLIIAGDLDPWEALYYVLYPTDQMLTLEAQLSPGTLSSRARGDGSSERSARRARAAARSAA